MKSFKVSFYLLITALSLSTACGERQKVSVEKPDSEMGIIAETDTFVTFREADGGIVQLPKKPQRTIVCLNSLLDIWYMAGGTALARVSGSINVPQEAVELPQLGSISTLNTELIMELQPDFLIVSYSETQRKVRDFFVSAGVPGVSINYATYDDFRVILELFTKLTGNSALYREVVIPLEEQVQSILNQVPELIPPPTVCILFSTSNYVKVETQNTLAGYFCRKLGAENIYKEKIIEGATYVELSLEYILEQDPDIIFATTMGDVGKCRARLETDVFSSDIWSGLTAVKTKRFIYPDISYSIYKPNRFYPEAFKIMAEFIYPDTEFVLE